MRPRFTERIGKRSPKTIVQIESMDIELRNGLWNIVTSFICHPLKKNTNRIDNSLYREFINDLWFLFFKEPLDEIPYSTNDFVSNVRKRFYEWDPMEIYDFLDFISGNDNVPIDNEEFIESCNFVLKRELSGFRFVSGYLAPITDENEIQSIQNAISNTINFALNGANIHLHDALNKLSDRQKPDYRNSIKESISAVESVCQKLTGDSNAELGKALKKLEKTTPIHGSLKQGFINIYGYTSDGDGIRHALMDETNLDQEDALFMLVTCSAFINYLIIKADKLGLLNDN